jgi:O-antigen/teichoic acid export membrane protein
MVSRFFDTAAYAVYAVGAIEIPLVGLLQASVNDVLFPEVVRLHRQGQRDALLRVWQTAIARTALVLFPAFFLLMLISRDLIVLLFSAKYQGSVLIFRVYLLLIPLRLTTFGLLLRAAGRTKYDLWGSLCALAANVGLGLLLLNLIGISGPAWATVLSLLVLVAFLLAMTSRHLCFRLRDLLPWKAIGKHALIGLLAYICVIVVNTALLSRLPQRGEIFHLLASALLFTLFYAVLLHKMSPGDMRMLLTWLRLRKISWLQ